MIDKIIDATEDDKGYKFTKVDGGIKVYGYFVPRENNQIILPQYDGSFDHLKSLGKYTDEEIELEIRKVVAFVRMITKQRFDL